MKKLLSLLLTTSMAIGFAGQVYAEKDTEAVFSDLSAKKYDWARDYIVTMANEGYIDGYTDGTYKPDNNVTRLETIVLFARAMGSNKEENSDVLNTAMDKYGDIVDALNLNFGQEEVAFMLYREALTEEDLNIYLSSDKAGKPMPRQEAAAIITKAMCGEADAMNEVLVDLEYKDAKDISPDYTQYVYYVSENEIMNGMDGGIFSPNSNVLRSQVAVMLFRAVDKINLYMEDAYVLELNKAKNTITIIDTIGEEVTLGYDDNTKFYIDGEVADENDIYSGSEAGISYINNKIAYVDLQKIVIDETKSGIYQGSTTTDGHSVLTFKDANSNEVENIPLSLYAEILNESGSNTTLSNITLGSYIEYDISNDQIVSMKQIKKDTFIRQALVDSIAIEDDLYLTISHEDEEYDGMKFPLNDSVIVYKNNDREDLSKIYKGDKIDITMEYGIVTKLVATSNTKTYEGTISEVIISSNPEIKVKIGGELKTFDVLSTTKVVVDGVESTLYDLRVGDNIKITTESGAVLTITTTVAAVSSNPITGTIEVVNTSKGFIKIDGETVFCNDSATSIISSNGSNKTMKDLADGMTVSVRGSLKNGAYTASLIIIED